MIAYSIFVLSALFAPLIAPSPPEQQNLMNKLKAPSAEHLMGTDKFGRDIFSRLLYGAQISLLVGFASVLGSITIGTIPPMTASLFLKNFSKKIFVIVSGFCETFS